MNLLVRYFFLLTALYTAALFGEFHYSYIPKKLYVNQIFPITILETDAQKEIPNFHFTSPIDNAVLVYKKPLIIRNGNDRFFSLYFKAGKNDIALPSLIIRTSYDSVELPRQTIPVKTLPKNESFCGVLATDMKIRYAQVSHFDESHYLVTLSIEAYEANLEDMHLKGFNEYGLENLQRNYAKVTGEFYVVIPETVKQLSFTYYNTVKERFVTLQTPIEINDATVVTQTDLNPQEDKFDLFKKYTVIAFAIFFFVMFLLERDFFFLAISTVLFIVLMTFYIPRKKICIQEGAPLYILPTETSNISTRIEHSYTTPLLNKRGVYNKIEYKHGIIGWVKDEDICQN
jgi:hypothetical protein